MKLVRKLYVPINEKNKTTTTNTNLGPLFTSLLCYCSQRKLKRAVPYFQITISLPETTVVSWTKKIAVYLLNKKINHELSVFVTLISITIIILF